MNALLRTLAAAALAPAFICPTGPAARAGELTPAQVDAVARIRCNNLTYAGDKTSVCFADKFLSTAASRTGLHVQPGFNEVRLDTDALFDSPFTVLSGEGTFRFSDTERQNLQRYLRCGGFLLASPGCSDSEWDKCFRRELKSLLPEARLVKIPMSHAIFSMVHQIPTLTLKGGGTTLVEGIEIDGRLVMIYSTEGLNDAGNAKGCCCCGGNQILQAEEVNVNILLYALLH